MNPCDKTAKRKKKEQKPYLERLRGLTEEEFISRHYPILAIIYLLQYRLKRDVYTKEIIDIAGNYIGISSSPTGVLGICHHMKKLFYIYGGSEQVPGSGLTYKWRLTEQGENLLANKFDEGLKCPECDGITIKEGAPCPTCNEVSLGDEETETTDGVSDSIMERALTEFMKRQQLIKLIDQWLRQLPYIPQTHSDILVTHEVNVPHGSPPHQWWENLMNIKITGLSIPNPWEEIAYFGQTLQVEGDKIFQLYAKTELSEITNLFYEIKESLRKSFEERFNEEEKICIDDIFNSNRIVRKSEYYKPWEWGRTTPEILTKIIDLKNMLKHEKLKLQNLLPEQ